VNYCYWCEERIELDELVGLWVHFSTRVMPCRNQKHYARPEILPTVDGVLETVDWTCVRVGRGY
jgi:hypothetical protein